MIGIAVIGYGYWGPNLVRNFALNEDARVVAVCDFSADRRAVVERIYPTVRTYADVDEMLTNDDVDAVVIATPVSTHFELAMRALGAGKHVFVEKPMTATVAEAEKLVAEAAERGLTLMVDHTFIYTSAVRKIHELISGPYGPQILNAAFPKRPVTWSFFASLLHGLRGYDERHGFALNFLALGTTG